VEIRVGSKTVLRYVYAFCIRIDEKETKKASKNISVSCWHIEKYLRPDSNRHGVASWGF